MSLADGVSRDQLDPPRWPRLGAAPGVDYDIDGKNLHGANGLGNTDFPCASLHHLPPSEKLLVELAKQHPHELTVVCIGPLTVFSRAMVDDSQQAGKDGKLELTVGETYQMKIIKLIPAERKIGLSIRALKNDEFRADWEAYTETTGRPEVTLGDHFKHQN